MSSEDLLGLEDKQRLLDIAWQAVRMAAEQRRRFYPEPESSLALQQARAAFVSLHKKTELRGCVGTVTAREPLYRAVADAAYSAAVGDPRFPPITLAELVDLDVEISVLSSFREIKLEDIIVGKHGLLVSQGLRRGLLLPQVPARFGWDATMFLAQTCRKAGLESDAWKHGAKIEAFTGQVFGE